MRYRTNRKYSFSRTYMILIFTLSYTSVDVVAQQEMTREERIRVLQLSKGSDMGLGKGTQQSTSGNRRENIERLELPPLPIFPDAVTENATVKRTQSQVEQVKNEYRLQKRDWWDHFRLNGNYTYGRYNVLNDNSTSFEDWYQSIAASSRHMFNVGASVNVNLSDLFNRPLRLGKHRYDIEQLQYSQEEVMEDRKLKVFNAYNAVTEQLATIKAKAESAALYNAQMKISENNFINGAIDIISLSLEGSRHSTAVVQYEQACVSLHDSIILLETLTNVKIVKNK